MNKKSLHWDSGEALVSARADHLCCGGRIRTYDLWVMSPTSYHCSTPRYLFALQRYYIFLNNQNNVKSYRSISLENCKVTVYNQCYWDPELRVETLTLQRHFHRSIYGIFRH